MLNRSKESKRNQLRLQDQFGIATEGKRQAMIVGLLSEIADSLAILCDLYAFKNQIGGSNFVFDEDEDDVKQ